MTHVQLHGTQSSGNGNRYVGRQNPRFNFAFSMDETTTHSQSFESKGPLTVIRECRPGVDLHGPLKCPVHANRQYLSTVAALFEGSF